MHPPSKVPPPLFDLGQVVSTPAVLKYLEGCGVRPAALLAFHQRGEWGTVCAEDRAANDRAVKEGSRILSSFEVEGRKTWVITEAVGDDGKRSHTTLLFPEEY
jgi:hypothetical protein